MHTSINSLTGSHIESPSLIDRCQLKKNYVYYDKQNLKKKFDRLEIKK